MFRSSLIDYLKLGTGSLDQPSRFILHSSLDVLHSPPLAVVIALGPITFSVGRQHGDTVGPNGTSLPVESNLDPLALVKFDLLTDGGIHHPLRFMALIP